MQYLVVLNVEPQDSPMAEGEFPKIQDLVSRLNDVLQDVTKQDDMTGWYVSKVSRIDRTDLLT